MTPVSAQHPRPAAQSHSRQTLLILALALALRLLVVWIVIARQPAGWLYQRGIEMGLLAQSLLAGHGLSSPFGYSMGPTGPTAFIAPGYPILVAGVFRIFGVYTQTSAAILMLLNVAANLLTIWLILHVTRKISESRLAQRAALIAGLFWACSPPLLWMPSIFWETSLSIALLLGFVALALRCRAKPTRPLWALLGLYAALAALINPALILALAAILGWTAFQTRPSGYPNILLAALVFCVAFSPWPIRNARIFHAFIPLRTTVGLELWMGNHDGANGFLNESLFPMYNPQELRAYIQQGEIPYTNSKSALAKTWVIHRPGTFFSLTLRRIFRFWTGTGNQHGSILFAFHATLTSLLGLAGLWMLFRRRRDLATLFALPLLLFPLPYYITHAEFRYRLILDPLLTILSAIALTSLLSRRWTATPKPTGEPAIG